MVARLHCGEGRRAITDTGRVANRRHASHSESVSSVATCCSEWRRRAQRDSERARAAERVASLHSELVGRSWLLFLDMVRRAFVLVRARRLAGRLDVGIDSLVSCMRIAVKRVREWNSALGRRRRRSIGLARRHFGSADGAPDHCGRLRSAGGRADGRTCLFKALALAGACELWRKKQLLWLEVEL